MYTHPRLGYQGADGKGGWVRDMYLCVYIRRGYREADGSGGWVRGNDGNTSLE
jgi:hypothetical protein